MAKVTLPVEGMQWMCRQDRLGQSMAVLAQNPVEGRVMVGSTPFT